MKNYLLIVLVFAFAKAYPQQPATQGKAVPSFGKTYPIPNPDFKTDTTATFKAVFDVAKAPEDPAETNRYIETVARFLNLHVQAGVSRDQLKAALIMHGNASYGLLKNEFYKEKYGVDNPNLALLQELDDAGVEIILCGQTAASRDLTPERRIDIPELSLSAMTALIQLQNQGYRLIAF